MARVKSYVIRVQNATKLGENAWPRLQNQTFTKSLTDIHILKSIVLASNTPRLIRGFRIRVIIFEFFIIFFSKLSISILERVDAFGVFTKSFQSRRRCAGQQAIFSLLLLVCTLRSSPGRRRMTPFAANSSCAARTRWVR